MRPARPYRLVTIATLFLLALVAPACGGGRATRALIVYEAKSAADKSTNVWTIDAATGASKQLTFGTSFDGNPGWSPDHTRIIFSSDRDNDAGKDDLYVMNADGSAVRRLTSTKDVTEWSAKFSPDGKRVAYVAVATDGYYLALMDPDGANQRHVAGPYRFAEFPAWRRNGPDEVFFSAIEQDRSDADIYSYDIATQQVSVRISTSAADVCPHVTYDGKTLSYASVAPGDENKDNIDLFAHDLSSDDTTGASDTRLTDEPGTDDYGNPSPDDKLMVFISTREEPAEIYESDRNAPAAGNTELYLMDRDGKNQRPLTDTPDSRENVPDW